jgi:hypothetical protein
MRRIIEADGRSILQVDSRRTLDLGEQQIDLAFQPAYFEAAACDGAVFDLGAIV